MFLEKAKEYLYSKQVLLLLCLLLFLFPGNSQNLSLQHFDADDGLPSSEVYRVFPDKTGRLWFCTDRGIAFYDSYKFTKIESINEDQVFLDGYCDEDGVCWFISINRKLYKWENKLIEMKFQNDFLSKFPSKFSSVNATNASNNFMFTIGNSIPYFIIKNHQNKFDTIDQTKLISDVTKTKSVTLKIYFGSISKITPYVVYFHSEVKKNNFQIYGDYMELTAALNTALDKTGLHTQVSKFNKNTYIVNINRELYLINIEKKTLTKWQSNPKLNFISCIVKYNNKYLLGSNQMGIFELDSSYNYVRELSEFKNILATSMNVDQENNLWISTNNYGILRLNDYSFLGGNLPDLNIKSIIKIENRLYLGFKNGDFGYLDNLSKYIPIGHSTAEIEFVGKSIYNQALINERILLDGKYYNFQPAYCKEMVTIGNQYYFMRSTGIAHYKHNKFNIIKGVNNSDIGEFYEPFIYLNDRLYSMAIFDSSHLLLGTKDKILKFSISDYKSTILLKTNYRVTNMKKNNSKYLIATLGDGLYILNEKLDEIKLKIQVKDGLSSNTIYKILIQDKNNIWLATNNGLNRIVFNNNLTLERIDCFDKSNGLPSNEINCIDYDNNILYIGTSKGLGILDLLKLHIPNYKPSCSITNVNIISDNSLFSRKNEFPYDQNNIRISFSAFTVSKSLTKPTYQYCLLKDRSKDTQWLFTNETSLQFTNLDPGNYSFIVKAQSRYGGFGPFSKYDFRITPHYTQTLWFKIFIGLVLLGIVFIIFYLRLSNVRNKSKLKQTIKTAQLESLRNQMNPHFIFNALNSVQNLIYANKNEEAGDFLGKISRMFRDALEFSRNSTIPLSVELEFIKRYLEIEKLRFPNKLAYSFFVSQEIENNMDAYEIPPLLMQPLIENSVKHGLKNISSIGTISISVIRNGDFIVYTMEDDCGGFSENLSTTHTSRGLSIIRDRINILNQIESHDSGYNFELINTPQKGVKAIITIPIN